MLKVTISTDEYSITAEGDGSYSALLAVVEKLRESAKPKLGIAVTPPRIETNLPARIGTTLPSGFFDDCKSFSEMCNKAFDSLDKS